MPTFIMSLSWTDQGVRGAKEFPKRSKAAREMAKKLGVDIKQVYVTSGDSDVVVIAETANGDNIAKFAMALGAQGNARTRTARAWTPEEFTKIVAALP
jgi:uncharacterized protein with GYD domain